MKQQIRYRMSKSDYYEILDLNRDCSEDEIKKSYKKLALRFHPDKNTHEGAKEVFNKINSAYSKLSNKQQKAIYDEKNKKQNQKSNFSKKKANSYAYNSNQYFSDSNRFYNFNNYFRSQGKQNSKQREQKRKQFQRQTQEMEKQFMKFFSKLFESAQRSSKYGQQKSRERYKQNQSQPQKNQQKQQTERLKKKYQQEKKEKQRKRRLEQEQRKKITFFCIFITIFLSVIVGPKLMELFSSKPLYSFNQNSTYRYQKYTKILNNTYYVSDKYMSSNLSPQKEASIQQLIDRKNILNLKKECSIAENQRKDLKQRAYKQKIGSKRSDLLRRAKNINFYPCQLLMLIAKNQPAYMNSLGS